MNTVEALRIRRKLDDGAKHGLTPEYCEEVVSLVEWHESRYGNICNRVMQLEATVASKERRLDEWRKRFRASIKFLNKELGYGQ